MQIPHFGLPQKSLSDDPALESTSSPNIQTVDVCFTLKAQLISRPTDFDSPQQEKKTPLELPLLLAQKPDVEHRHESQPAKWAL